MDCSTDGTFAILERLAAGFPQNPPPTSMRKRGQGRGRPTAIQKATGDFSLIQDADLEYDPPSIPACCARCSTGTPTRFSVSRYMAGEQTRHSFPFGTP